MFNLFFSYRYVPATFAQSTVVTLVKCKGGDFSDVNNYRAIKLSNSITKILETVLVNKVTPYTECNAYHFGF